VHHVICTLYVLTLGKQGRVAKLSQRLTPCSPISPYKVDWILTREMANDSGFPTYEEGRGVLWGGACYLPRRFQLHEKNHWAPDDAE
jgi:hypothetical protein